MQSQVWLQVAGLQSHTLCMAVSFSIYSEAGHLDTAKEVLH